MLRKTSPWAAVALLLILTATAQAGPPWSGEVLKAVDGDSLIVARGRTPVRVWLFGIDAPEWSQPYGPAAKRQTPRRRRRSNMRRQPFSEKILKPAVVKDWPLRFDLLVTTALMK